MRYLRHLPASLSNRRLPNSLSGLVKTDWVGDSPPKASDGGGFRDHRSATTRLSGAHRHCMDHLGQRRLHRKPCDSRVSSRHSGLVFSIGSHAAHCRVTMPDGPTPRLKTQIHCLYPRSAVGHDRVPSVQPDALAASSGSRYPDLLPVKSSMTDRFSVGARNAMHRTSQQQTTPDWVPGDGQSHPLHW